MKKLSILIYFWSFGLFASADIPYEWNSVHIEANDDVSVKLKRNLETGKIKYFEFVFDGNKTVVPKTWFEDLDRPRFDTVRITYGCSQIIKEDESSVFTCSSHINFKYWIDPGDEELPDWYEEPEVTFYIESGVLTERLTKIKDSENHWSLSWLEADGSKSKDEIKRF
ncbi:MAG TPA: hypothetical protein DCS87_03410 [Rheinheimera sp.]|nr:hypothetical protein [Rheinheimera sp.]